MKKHIIGKKRINPLYHIIKGLVLLFDWNEWPKRWIMQELHKQCQVCVFVRESNNLVKISWFSVELHEWIESHPRTSFLWGMFISLRVIMCLRWESKLMLRKHSYLIYTVQSQQLFILHSLLWLDVTINPIRVVAGQPYCS